MELTNLENTVLNAYELAAGLAALALVHDLVKKNDELRLKKQEVPISGQTMTERKELITEIRRNNQALALVAAVQEVAGISA